MYKKIEQLDDLTINKIAAGEVVEGPFSVVKELIENSIDAGGNIITLDIKDGGKTYIRVTDNGGGIKEEYVEKAFLRHSTSKITSIRDLTSINSLGFRGEALASIAAVSQIEIVTRTEDQEYGILMELAGGNINMVKKVGCPVGTTIIVRNLFFNTPARLKFMRSNSAETSKISEIVTRLSLSNPAIAFKYVNNNNIMYTTPGNNKLSDTILSIFDKNTFKKLIYLQKEYLDMKLEGYISQPELVRGNRSLQIIYINGRYVKDRLISRAIEEAYKERVTINKYPVCILNLYMEPSQLDVNVHPAKIEVKFENEEEIYKFIKEALASTLETHTNIGRLKLREGDQVPGPRPKTRGVTNNIGIKPLIGEADQKYSEFNKVGNINKFIDMEINNYAEEIQANVSEDISQSSFLNMLLEDYKIIGQIFNTYIILEKESSIYLIDQHAAHERLIYNQFLKEIKNGRPVSQILMEAEVLDLANEDYIFLLDNIDLFKRLGFSIEDFGVNTAIIREVPLILGRPKSFSFIYEILDNIKDKGEPDTYLEDAIIKRACREAIKAKDKLDYHEMKKLIGDLVTLTPPLTCPHGRPIILTMDQYDIEKYFKRVQ